MVADGDLNGKVLGRMVRELKDSPERLKKMGERAAVLAQPRAAEKIVDLCYAMVRDE
jgi:UDP-N-acetylglucosamine:LPS N-acetylglucosamine transferase